MKSLARISATLVLVCLAALTPVLTASAQGGDPRCLGLNEADCQIFLNATDKMSAITSFTVPEWSVAFSFSDGTESVAFEANGQAGFAFAPDGSELVMHIIVESLAMEPDTMGDFSFSELIMTQDMVYILANGTWYGASLEEAGLGDLSALTDLSGMGTDAGDLSGLEALDLSGAITMTREADIQAMGQSLAVFKVDVDLAQLVVTLLSSPVIGEILGAEGGDLGMGEMTPEDVNDHFLRGGRWPERWLPAYYQRGHGARSRSIAAGP